MASATHVHTSLPPVLEIQSFYNFGQVKIQSSQDCDEVVLAQLLSLEVAVIFFTFPVGLVFVFLKKNIFFNVYLFLRERVRA